MLVGGNVEEAMFRDRFLEQGRKLFGEGEEHVKSCLGELEK